MGLEQGGCNDEGCFSRSRLGHTGGAHLSTGVEVFSMKLIIFSFTFTDLDLRANVILLTRDLTPLPSPVVESP